jgi:hypothetical protein
MDNTFRTNKAFSVIVIPTKSLANHAPASLQGSESAIVMRLNTEHPDINGSKFFSQLPEDHLIVDEHDIAIALPLKGKSHAIPVEQVVALNASLLENVGLVELHKAHKADTTKRTLSIYVKDTESPGEPTYKKSPFSVEIA